MNKLIEKLIDKEDWTSARKSIIAALKKDPEHHWLLTRLSLTYYEEKNYEKALEVVQQAYKVAPKCPLVLWDYAGTLQMLGHHKEAIKIYKAIIAKDVEEIAYGECGEGKGKARGLIADCYFRLSESYKDMGLEKLSFQAFEKHIDLRGPGCNSIYPLKDLNKIKVFIKNKKKKV